MTKNTPTDRPAALTLRGPKDLAALGPFLKAARRAAGFRSARQAAPHLGATVRLLVEVERGERTKRGITLGKLLTLLEQLGYELELRPRRSAMHARLHLAPPPPHVAGTEGSKQGDSRNTVRSTRQSGRSRPTAGPSR